MSRAESDHSIEKDNDSEVAQQGTTTVIEGLYHKHHKKAKKTKRGKRTKEADRISAITRSSYPPCRLFKTASTTITNFLSN